MQVSRQVAMAFVAALALGATGCAEFLTALQKGQAQGGIDPAARKGAQAGINQAAEAQDAVEIARKGDDYRDAPVADYQSAHYAYRKALELEPRNTYVLVAQATAYLRQGAETKFSNPDGSATTDSSKLRTSDQFFRRAKTLADRSLQVNASYGTAHFVLAEMYALQADYPKALEKLDFIEKNKVIPEGHASTFYAWRGFVKKVSGQDDAAKADFELALEYSEPIELAEYAERIVNPPLGADAGKPIEKKAVVRSF